MLTALWLYHPLSAQWGRDSLLESSTPPIWTGEPKLYAFGVCSFISLEGPGHLPWQRVIMTCRARQTPETGFHSQWLEQVTTFWSFCPFSVLFFSSYQRYYVVLWSDHKKISAPLILPPSDCFRRQGITLKGGVQGRTDFEIHSVRNQNSLQNTLALMCIDSQSRKPPESKILSKALVCNAYHHHSYFHCTMHKHLSQGGSGYMWPGIKLALKWWI